MLEAFLPLVHDSSCRTPQLWVIRRGGSCAKILPKILLPQHCDLTLYYTGLNMSTSRMQRCPPLSLWFSAARAPFPRDRSAVEGRYMDTAGLRQRRSACTETGLRLRTRRSEWLGSPKLTFLSGVCPLWGRRHVLLFALGGDAGGRRDGCMILQSVWGEEEKAARHSCSQVYGRK